MEAASSSAICRTCLLESNEMHSLYKPLEISQRNEELSLFLKELTNLECIHEDGLPVFICQECFQHVSNAITFKDMCLKSNDVLRGKCVIKIEEVLIEESSNPENIEEELSRLPKLCDNEKILKSPKRRRLKKSDTSDEEIKDEFSNDEALGPLENFDEDDEDYKTVELERKPKARSKKQKYPLRKKHEKAKIPLPPGPPYECGTCGAIRKSYTGFYNHMTTHSDEAPYLCNYCGAKFKIKKAYDYHMIVHGAENPNRCEICGKTFRNANNLKVHRLSHKGEKPHLCPICGIRMSQKCSLKIHMAAHSRTERTCKCEICGKLFFTNYSMKRHIKMTHNKTKQFVCSICDNRYGTKDYLQVHMLKHTGEKPHPCEFCNRAFTTRAVLKRHMYQHTGEKRFKCNICTKGFIQKHCYDNHMAAHRNNGEIVVNNEDEPIGIV